MTHVPACLRLPRYPWLALHSPVAPVPACISLRAACGRQDAERFRNGVVNHVVHRQLKAVDADRADRRAAEHAALLVEVQAGVKAQWKQLLVRLRQTLRARVCGVEHVSVARMCTIVCARLCVRGCACVRNCVCGVVPVRARACVRDCVRGVVHVCAARV